jgi:hypothetical protein
MVICVEHLVEWHLTGETKILREHLSQCPLSTTNPTWPHLESNLGSHSGKPGSNCLSYGWPVRLFGIRRTRSKPSFASAVLSNICMVQGYSLNSSALSFQFKAVGFYLWPGGEFPDSSAAHDPEPRISCHQLHAAAVIPGPSDNRCAGLIPQTYKVPRYLPQLKQWIAAQTGEFWKVCSWS